MYGLVRKLFFVFLVVAVVGFALRNYVLKYAVEYQLGQSTGFTASAAAIDFSQLQPPSIAGFELTLENPAPFQPKQAVVIDQFEGAPPDNFWSDPQPRWGQLTLKVEELVLIRAPNGDYNLAYLDGFQSPKRPPTGPDAPLPLIDTLTLSVERLAFYDYRGRSYQNNISPTVLRVELNAMTYRDVTDLGALQRLIVQETLRRTRTPELGDARRYFRVEAPLAPASP